MHDLERSGDDGGRTLAVVIALIAAAMSWTGANARHSPSPPVPADDPATWITHEDLVYERIYERSEWVFYRLVISRAGRVVACTIVRRSDDRRFAERVCRAITARARFHPATTGNGSPTSGTYEGSVRSEIPD